jgi:hypothetical protein
MNDPVVSLLADLRRTRFRDLAGARVSARLPLSAALLNRVAADTLRRTTIPVRSIDVRPLDDDRFDLVVATKWAFVPPLTITLAIDRQPMFPDAPVLTLRWSLTGLGAIASQFVSRISALPDGIRIQQDRILLDIATLVARSPAAEAVPYIRSLALHSVQGVARIDVEMGVDDGAAAVTGTGTGD